MWYDDSDLGVKRGGDKARLRYSQTFKDTFHLLQYHASLHLGQYRPNVTTPARHYIGNEIVPKIIINDTIKLF